MAHIIVVGNEKGGAGKSTVAMHISTALAHMGARVGAVDLDLRQRTFATYIANRDRFRSESGTDLPGPALFDLPQFDQEAADSAETGERLLREALAALDGSDFAVIDCPGSHTRLSALAHSLADTLATPLNDSFVDFDLLAHVDADGETVLRPSIYAEMVWTARQTRAQEGRPATDWIVLRNRLAVQQMTNKRKVGAALENLSRRIGFRVAPGFSERVVFRELFPKGLTLLDLSDAGVRMTMSHVAARRELREMIAALKLPGIEVAL